MKTPKEDKSQDQSTESSGMENFNFEQWAKQVRPLLLAAVQKRGSR